MQHRLNIVLFFLLCFSQTAQGLDYQKPDDAMSALVDRPLSPGSHLSPDRKLLLNVHRRAGLAIADIAQNEAKLAGLRFNTQSLSPSRKRSAIKGLTLTHLHDFKRTTIPLPKGQVIALDWSPDSKHIVFVVEQTSKTLLWLYSLSSKTMAPLSNSPINNIFGQSAFQWAPDSQSVITRLAINHNKMPPERPVQGPIVEETNSKKSAVVTYQDLLQNAHDAEAFSHYAQSQIIEIKLDGSIKKIVNTNLVMNFSLSPDGTYILLQYLTRPFSYRVPYYRFPRLVQLYTRDGKPDKVLARLKHGENIPAGFDSVNDDPRDFAWRDDKPATVYFKQALDEGDMKKAVPFHDALMLWPAPFTKEPEMLAKFAFRLGSIRWGTDDIALVRTWRFSDRQEKTIYINPKEKKVVKVLKQRSYNDRYNNPGRAVSTYNKMGRKVLKVYDDHIFLYGRGASNQGDIPFVDKLSLKTGEKKRIWRSQAPYYQQFYHALDDKMNTIIISEESPTQPRNIYHLDLRDQTKKALTFITHAAPAYKGVKRDLVRFKRSDGVDLSADLYLPPGYKRSQGPLPVLIWAYPREFKDKAVASQRAGSPYEFNRISFWGPVPYLVQGFAVMDRLSMPIIGTGDKRPNDTFIEQLTMNAQAAIRYLDKAGIGDKNRMAIGGHSYGAFMVANLLAHTNLFKAGIARSGAYNRSLTPFGFQGEPRNLWEATSTYQTLSPFFHADKINEPLLLIHGEQDNNTGTYLMQSQRLFSALNGLGGTARLVILPKESHGYAARESILHMLWEQSMWLKQYVQHQSKRDN